MNNIKTFEEFNFNRDEFPLIDKIFGGKHEKIGRKIFKYIKDHDDIGINIAYPVIRGMEVRVKDGYQFNIRGGEGLDIDPLGEENWEGDITIKALPIHLPRTYRIFLNDDKLNLSKSLQDKIGQSLKRKYEKGDIDRREDRIRQAAAGLR